MTQKEIYILMNCWQQEGGESFLEYFIGNCHNVLIPKLELWMWQRGYINSEKLNTYADKYIGAKTVWDHPDYEVLVGYENDYSVFPYGEGDELAELKSLYILSEYISLHENWINRLYDFAYKGISWSTREGEFNKNLDEVVRSWRDGDSDDFDLISKTSIEEINNRLEKEYNKGE